MIAKGEFISRLLAAAVVAWVVAAGANAAGEATDPETRPGRLTTLPDGRRLNFRCSGEGAPTIVLESGFGASSLAWYKVQPVLARRYRVCAYDRAGSGFSDPGPLPRDGAAIAKDLDDGLRAAGIGGPFIVVGHSSGGLYVRLFADRRAREVVGMVLADPTVEFQNRRLEALFGHGAGGLEPLIARAERCRAAAVAHALPSSDPALKACGPASSPSPAVAAARRADAGRIGKWDAQISELRTLLTTTSQEVADGHKSYGAMPLVVLTADGTNASAPLAIRPTLDEASTAGHREIAARSTRGREVKVTGSSHLMMIDRPEAIIAAVDEVAALGRKSRVQ